MHQSENPEEGERTDQEVQFVESGIIYTQRIGKAARRELALNGYTHYQQLTTVTAKQLLKIHGVGPKAIRILEEELDARGLRFAKS